MLIFKASQVISVVVVIACLGAGMLHVQAAGPEGRAKCAHGPQQPGADCHLPFGGTLLTCLLMWVRDP